MAQLIKLIKLRNIAYKNMILDASKHCFVCYKMIKVNAPPNWTIYRKFYIQSGSKFLIKTPFREILQQYPLESAFSSIVCQPRLIHSVSRSNLVDMLRALYPSKSKAVKSMLELDLPHDVIATKVKCSEVSVRRIFYNLVHFGTVRHPPVAKRGRPSKITREMELVPCFSHQSECTNFRDCLTFLVIDVQDILMRCCISFGTNMVGNFQVCYSTRSQEKQMVQEAGIHHGSDTKARFRGSKELISRHKSVLQNEIKCSGTLG